MIREVIVVEGKDDISAVRRAVDADLICTRGFGWTPEIVEQIRAAQQRCGVIILTDPDHAGDHIRERLAAMIGECKHAHIPRALCFRDGDIGVENASPEAIRAALDAARCEHAVTRREFSTADLARHRLTGSLNASTRRARLGETLGVGAVGASRFLKRLNHYGVTREEFEEAVVELDA